MSALEPRDEWRSNPQWLEARGRMLARLRQRKAGEYAAMRADVDANAAHPTPLFFNSAFAAAFRIFDQEQAAQRDASSGDSEAPAGGDGVG